MEPYASALEQAAAIRDRSVGAEERTRAHLERIERLNPRLNAFWTVTADLALEQARAADARAARSESRGPLDGVALSIKDLYSVAGVPTTMGSRTFEHQVFDWDHDVVARLRAAGCVFLGKTTTPEFGSRPHTEHGLHGAARNPWNEGHTTGGSSGGAAGALAAGLGPLAHGSDGGGSIRVPASCCGVVGLKPTRGLLSPAPFGESWAGLSTQGPLAWTIADVAALLDAMAGHAPGDPFWADREASYLAHAHPPARPLRVGMTVAAPGVTVEAETAAAVTAAARVLEAAGHRVEAVAPDTSALRHPFAIIPAVGVASLPIPDPELLEPANRFLHEMGAAITGAQYQQAINLVRMLSRPIVAFWDTHDLLLTPTLTAPAPPLDTLGVDPARGSDEFLDWLSFTYPYNCTGQPALSLPTAQHSSGLPIGVQLVGPPRGEDLLLQAGALLEEALPWRGRRPPLG